jgi:sialic acid synthase
MGSQVYRKNLDMKALPSIPITEKKSIGDDQPCFIVAEVGQNHNGSMSMALELLDNIAFYKADAAKFCKRHVPSDLTHEAYNLPYPGPQSFGETYGKHREFLELPIEQYDELKTYSASKGLVFFATACDMTSVDELESINVPMYKIASRDLENLPLIERVARTGKPVVLSTGMSSLVEIHEALDTVRRFHNRVVLLECTSAYPTPPEDIDLRVLAALRREFDVLVGMSDHSIGVTIPVVAAALGAVLVEKHVTLGRHLKGTDHACSLEPEGLRRVVRDIRAVEMAMGDGRKRVRPSAESAARKLSRSLVTGHAIPAGTVLTEGMITLKSPGGGLRWLERGRVVGHVAKHDIPADVMLLPEWFT